MEATFFSIFLIDFSFSDQNLSIAFTLSLLPSIALVLYYNLTKTKMGIFAKVYLLIMSPVLAILAFGVPLVMIGIVLAGIASLITAFI